MAKLSNDTCLIMWSKSNNDGIEMFLVPTRPCEQIYWHDFGDMVSLKYEVGVTLIRATSHMRLRARDRYTSSTLIGGKGGAGSKFASHYA